MQATETKGRFGEAIAAFNEHEHRFDGEQIVASLNHGLTTLRNLLYQRIHEDVEHHLGPDSMLMPLSVLDCEKRAKVEIEVFAVIEASLEAHGRKYVGDRDWFSGWLAQLRLGDYGLDAQIAKRFDRYKAGNVNDRRLLFSSLLESAVPEATRAPLVLYRLFPLAAGIVTSVAFNDSLNATELRNKQAAWLPGITDCNDCHGRPLDNGERCGTCGNPVWNFRWLTSL